jgi:hypothetical protein
MATQLFSIEVYYTHGNESKREVYKNITGKKLLQFRQDFFSAGVAVPDSEDPAKHWTIISPFNITSIDVWLQDKFYIDYRSTNNKL